MDDKLREKWEKLYESAKQIVKLEPWKWIKEEQLIEIEAYEGLNFYLSVMGFHGMFEGIILFTSKKDLFTYVEMQEKPFPDFQGMNYQQGILLIFNERQYMIPENLEIADSIMKRQIKGKLIAFESFVKGYMPSRLTEEELDDSIIAFCSFAKALELFDNTEKNINKNNKSNNEKDKNILKMKKNFIDRFDKCMHVSYDEDTDNVEVKITKNPEITEYMPECIISDELLDVINKCKKVNDCYEMEFLNFLPLPVKTVKYKTPVMNESIEKNNLIRYMLIVSEKSGIKKFKLIERPFMSEEDHFNYVDEFLDELLDVFQKNGVPEEIVVRDDNTRFMLEDMCDKLDIELIDEPRLLVIDDVINEFVENMINDEGDDYDDEEDDE